MAEATGRSGIGFAEGLTFVFLGLKLGHVIDWSWWWVLSPSLIALGITVVACVLTAALTGKR